MTHSKWICNNVVIKMIADMFSLCPTWIIRGGVSHRTSLESGVWSMKQEDGPFHSSHRKAAWFMSLPEKRKQKNTSKDEDMRGQYGDRGQGGCVSCILSVIG